MTINKIMLIILLCILAVPVISCAPGSQTDELPINRDVAIMVAAANVPSSVIGETSVATLWDDSNWVVHFSLTENRTVTKNDLGWSESPNTRFEHWGMLPVDTYRLLTFTIDRRTGAVLSRQASDSVLLGGPGIFDTEPPERASLPLWSAIASGIGGMTIGGMIVWLIMRRKKITG